MTPGMVVQFCKKHSYGCGVVWNEEVIAAPAGHPILAFAVREEHCYFCTGAAVRMALSRKRSGELTARLRMASQKPRQTPPALNGGPGSSR